MQQQGGTKSGSTANRCLQTGRHVQPLPAAKSGETFSYNNVRRTPSDRIFNAITFARARAVASHRIIWPALFPLYTRTRYHRRSFIHFHGMARRANSLLAFKSPQFLSIQPNQLSQRIL